jgi:hypothetical protein
VSSRLCTPQINSFHAAESQKPTGNNKRFKDWGLLKQVYQHEISSHDLAFRAITVITQLAINGGRRYLSVAAEIPLMKMVMTMTMIFEESTNNNNSMDYSC